VSHAEIIPEHKNRAKRVGLTYVQTERCCLKMVYADSVDLILEHRRKEKAADRTFAQIDRCYWKMEPAKIVDLTQGLRIRVKHVDQTYVLPNSISKRMELVIFAPNTPHPVLILNNAFGTT